MLINLTFYDEEVVKRIIKKIELYCKESTDFRISDKTIWFNNMYIAFENNKLITINLFNKPLNYKSMINKFLHYLLENEEVCIHCYQKDKISAVYYEKVDNDTDLSFKFRGGSRTRRLQ